MILIAMIFILTAMLLVWWLVIWLCGKIGQESFGEKGRKIGRRIPFWLGVSGIAYLIIFNIIEYYQVKNYVTYQCQKNAGVFVYVTPDEWRKQNPKEWENIRENIRLNNNKFPDLIINDLKFKPVFIYNSRMVNYYYSYENEKNLLGWMSI